MTTELVLLLGLFVFLVGTTLFGEKGPFAMFRKSGPRLGARIERNLTTGREFAKVKGGAYLRWEKPEGAAPDGRLK